MYLVDGAEKSAMSNKSTKDVPAQTQAPEVSCIESVISLMNNIVETACEHEPDLGLMRLVNLMDLYRVHLQLAAGPASDSIADVASMSGLSDNVLTQKLGNTEFVSFERFVRDSRLLKVAAIAASRDSGETVAPPTPLTVSANV
ncbi:MAG: hypothetical protein AB8B64_15000 [Granulosicoccus sp.]